MKPHHLVAFASVALGLRILTAAPVVASADTRVIAPHGEPLVTSQDCAKGCIECQRKCHESSCMEVCTAQWSGCCMSAGMKPPPMGACGCAY